VKKIAVLPAEKLRDRNSRIGGGSGARRSQATNATSSTTPATIEAISSALAQPTSLPPLKPQTMLSTPAVINPRPRRSRPVSGP
jgi:hypothetical protein